MTWTKTGSEFPDDLANIAISDAAYRTHHEAITWLYVVERTDCLIPKGLVRRFAVSESYEAAIKELVAHGLWTDLGATYEVVHQGDVIRSGIVAQRKKLERDKRASANYRKKQNVSADVIADADRQTDKQAIRTDEESAFNDDAWMNGGRS